MGGKLGQFWLLGSAVILFAMGIACAASCLGASTLPTDTIDSVCPAIYKAGPCLTDACLSTCDNDPSLSGTAVDDCRKACTSDGSMTDLQKEREIKKCNVDLYRGNGCICMADADPDSCDCSGTGLQNFIDFWALLSLAFGLLGLVGAIVFTGVPAQSQPGSPFLAAITFCSACALASGLLSSSVSVDSSLCLESHSPQAEKADVGCWNRRAAMSLGPAT